MSSQPGQNPTSRPSNTPKEAQKTLSPKDQEFSDIVNALKKGTIVEFVRLVNVGGR
jgi:hypothetical protein